MSTRLERNFRNNDLGKELIEFAVRNLLPKYIHPRDIEFFIKDAASCAQQVSEGLEVLRDEPVTVSIKSRANILGEVIATGYDFTKKDYFGIPGEDLYRNHLSLLKNHGNESLYHEELGISPYEESSQFQPGYGFILMRKV
ncbi:hypothetical protein HYT56_02490 [Candidatus Woesearchaeota archaeon]|nr:hypothetical protein [Candidatus Woesearchaeota archaeon]